MCERRSPDFAAPRWEKKENGGTRTSSLNRGKTKEDKLLVELSVTVQGKDPGRIGV